MRTTLFSFFADGSPYVSDGVFLNFDENYSNYIDDNDAIKSSNTGENLSIKSNNRLLVVERRHLSNEADTIFLQLTGVRAAAYRFELTLSKLDRPGMSAYLEDNYLQIKTLLDLNEKTIVDFNVVNIPGSYAANRFRILLIRENVLDVSNGIIFAWNRPDGNHIKWKLEAIDSSKSYFVERSEDGYNFSKINVRPRFTNNSHAYEWVDSNITAGKKYYRIESIDQDGKTSYSKVIALDIATGSPAFSLFPNPVRNGKIQLYFQNQQPGLYEVVVIDVNGRELVRKKIFHQGGNQLVPVVFTHFLPRGIYQLFIMDHRGSKPPAVLAFAVL